MLPIDLERVLNEGDVAGCIALFANATDNQRSSMSKIAVARLKKLTTGVLGRLSQRFGALTELHSSIFEQLGIKPEQLLAAQVAVLACAPFGELKKLGMRAMPDADEAYAVLAARRPPWLDEWADFACELSGDCWPLVRRLIREGLCKRPQGDGYIQGMLSLGRRGSAPPRRIIDELMDDPELLEHEVWRIFEVEPKRQFGFSGYGGGRPEYSWSSTLSSLWHAGKLSRTRLLDASLDALHRDFSEENARWFASFHEKLTPTIDERADLTERYLSLLHSRNRSTVLFAVKSLSLLQKAKRLDAVALLENIGPALGGRTKSTVSPALKLLARAARTEGAGDRAAAVAAQALVHQWPEVQEAAVDIIERWGRANDPGIRDLVQEHLPGLVPSQRNRLTSWLQAAGHRKPARQTLIGLPDLDACRERIKTLDARLSETACVPALLEICERGEGDIPAVPLDAMEIPRLDPEERIEPIDDLDMLIERFAALLEDPTSPDEVERVLDGVSRLCGDQPTDFNDRIAPLQAQATQIAGNLNRTEWSEAELRAGLSLLAIRWAEGPAASGKDPGIGARYLTGGIFTRDSAASSRGRRGGGRRPC